MSLFNKFKMRNMDLSWVFYIALGAYLTASALLGFGVGYWVFK